MIKIILDTNFLMIPFKFKVDIFSEISRLCNFNYGLHVYQSSLGELRKVIAEQKGIDKKSAQFALKLIALKNIRIIESEDKDVDSLILENLEKDSIIATLDIALKKKLLDLNAPVIILRSRKYLQFARPLV